MTRSDRQQRRWLDILRKARAGNAKASAAIDVIAASGLLDPQETVKLRAVARRDAVNIAARRAFRWPVTWTYPIVAAMGASSGFIAQSLVGSGQNLWPSLFAAAGTELAAGLLLWASFTAEDHLAGPGLTVPARWNGDRGFRIRGVIERRVSLDRIIVGAIATAPPIGLAFVALFPLRGVVAVAVVAPMLTCVMWLLTLVIIRAVLRERSWRVALRHNRGLPLSLDVATGLMWRLVTALRVQGRWHGGPTWLVALFRYHASARGQLASSQWATGVARGNVWRRRLMAVEAAEQRLWLEYADAFEQATSAEQYREAIENIRDHLRLALSGDISFLVVKESSRAWWLRMLLRLLPAVALGAAAVGLPFLPGVSAKGAALAGVQVGLAVAAVLTLISAPSDAQKAVSDAIKSATGAK